VAVDLTQYVERIEKRIESPAVTQAASEAMAEEVTTAVKVALGGDLAMSGMRGGRARIDPKVRPHQAVVSVSGAAFTLIDKGRRRAVRAKAAPRSGLATPWGPRASVKGSTTAGQHVLDRVASKAFSAGAEAAAEVAFEGR